MFWILVLALVLRLPLMTQSLWLDEAIEALALMGHKGPILEYALKDFQPPLYHFLLLPWTKLLGYSEFVLRTPSLLAGLATVYFTFKLANLLRNQKAAYFAGLLVATNPLLIYYSAEGRTYMLTACFVTASFYYFLSLLRNPHPSRSSTVLYLLFTALSLWTSYLAWLVIFVQFFYLLLHKEFRLLRYPILAFSSLLLWLPSFWHSLRVGLATVSSSPAWGKVVGGISLKAIALTWIKPLIGRISFANRSLYAAIVSASSLLHFLVFSRLKRSRFNSLLVASLLGTILLASLISLFVPVYSYFRLLFLVPLYLSLLATALSQSPKLISYLVLGSQLVFTGIYLFSPHFHHENWRGLTNYLSAQADGIVAMPSLAQNAPLEYYQLSLPLTEIKNKEILEDSPVFYIRYLEDVFDGNREGRANLEESGYTLTKEVSFTSLPLEIYEKK